MKSSEALDAVERMLDELGLVDKNGDPIEGLQAIVALHRHFPGRLAAAEDRFFVGAMTADEYVAEVRAMIEDFKRVQFVLKLDKQLASLGGQSA